MPTKKIVTWQLKWFALACSNVWLINPMAGWGFFQNALHWGVEKRLQYWNVLDSIKKAFKLHGAIYAFTCHGDDMDHCAMEHPTSSPSSTTMKSSSMRAELANFCAQYGRSPWSKRDPTTLTAHWAMDLPPQMLRKDHPPRWIKKVHAASDPRSEGWGLSPKQWQVRQNMVWSFKGLSAAQFFIKTSWFTSWFIAALAKLPSSKALWESSITQSWVAVGWWTTTGIRTRNVVNQTSCI